jgi:lactate dehydrogenase-like 2-hydroxyacid dehydrogenase
VRYPASAAGVTAHAVAEHAMAMILALRRHLHTGRDNQARKYWRGMISNIPAREDQLEGKQLLIIGLGRVGTRLAKLAKAFGMRVVGTKRDPSRRGRGGGPRLSP